MRPITAKVLAGRAAPRGQIRRAQRREGLQIVRHAGIHGQQQLEVSGHYADHRLRLAVHLDPAADDRLIAAESALKQTPAQNKTGS